MRAEELMVGDWVEWKNKPVQIAKVSGIVYSFGHIDVVLAHCGSGLLENHDIKSIKPILLTEELFKKSGFELCKESWTSNYTFYFSKDKRVQISDLTNSGDGYWNIHVDNEDMETIGSCDVKYVHEMQHLLRLCRYELDLKI